MTIYFIFLGDGYFPVMTLTTLLTKLHKRSKLSRLFLKRYYNIVLNLFSIFHRFVLKREIYILIKGKENWSISHFCQGCLSLKIKDWKMERMALREDHYCIILTFLCILGLGDFIFIGGKSENFWKLMSVATITWSTVQYIFSFSFSCLFLLSEYR